MFQLWMISHLSALEGRGKGVDCVTGTTSSVARKLLMKSNRKLSEERSFPSTLMERGTSGRTLTAAFRKASAGGGGEKDGEREEGREVTRKKGGSQGKERGKITMLGTAETKQTELTIVVCGRNFYTWFKI